MSHPLFWPTVIYFYPMGNTSAVCLTENLAPETKADILLLACGDPRHILYTVHTNESNPLTFRRAFDITCCDVDVAVLARNTLFTLLTDDHILDKLETLWTLFYHIFVDQTSLSMLFDQCRKLITLAESEETWRAGPYGHFLTTCDAATRVALRRVWSTYLDTAAFSSDQTKLFEERFVDGMRKMHGKMGYNGTTTADRSAGSFAPSTGGRGEGQKRHLTVNPTFAFSIDGDKFSVHYGSDPLSGFHLAEAFASGKFTQPHESIPSHEVVRVAKSQFFRWCTSMNKRLKGNNPLSPTFTIRMFGGDALMFCQALKYCEMTRTPVTPYNTGAWRLSTITLDDRAYGCDVRSHAPLSSNVIDTSNILDHAGLINVLVVTAPLLCTTPSATLYTEALLRTGEDNPSHVILEHVCGDLATMALLGIIPSTFISQFTTRSNVHETFKTSKGTKQYHERLAWKAIGLEGSRTKGDPDDARRPSLRLCFIPENVAAFLFHVYTRMFSSEDIESRVQLLTLSPERIIQKLRCSGIIHYNRRSFALLVHFMKTRVQTDWWRAMDMFEDFVLMDGRLMIRQHAYQELCCQLHLLGVYTTKWMSASALRCLCLEYMDGTLALFRDWTLSCIPQVVTVVLVVPRDAITRLEPDFMDVGTPELHCDMHDGPRQNLFAVISATFGSLRVHGTGEHRTGVIVQGNADAGTDSSRMQPLWRTNAPLIVTFSVAATSLMDFAQNPRATVGLALRASMGVITKFSHRLGINLTVFRTELTNAERVVVLARRPVVCANESTSTGVDASVTASVVTGDWGEETREGVRSEVATRTNIPHETLAEVHVQLDDASSAVQSFTVRIDVADPGARAALANSQTVPTVHSDSGSMSSFEACVRVGVHPFTVHFPLPVEITRVKLRVARRSSYVEVVAPLAPFAVRPECDLSIRFAPLSPGHNDNGIPELGSIHRLDLDRCPVFKLLKGQSVFDWYNIHICLMFSQLERKRLFLNNSEQPSNDSSSTPGTLLHLKQTLHILLGSAAGARPDGKPPQKVFALCDTSRHRSPYLYIVVSCMRLDVGSHTVVADAFVALAIPPVQAALCIATRNVFPSTTIRPIVTNADEKAAWFHLLPRLVERCRTWLHKTSCIYRTRTKTLETTEMWERQSPLCACGAGVGVGSLPKSFERVAPYLTRAAFNPLFSVPYLKEVDVPVAVVEKVPEERRATDSCSWNADVGKTHATASGMGCQSQSCDNKGGLVCSRCKCARYCSKVCQVAGWRAHKKNCEIGGVRASGSVQT